jgi:hypothetical protein
MALTKNDRLLIEGIKSMLAQDAKLGLAFHDQDKATQEAEQGFEYLHEQINDMFAVRAAELTHADSVCRAFHKVHSYKYLEDPFFQIVMDKEMISTAVPAEERNKALKFIPTIIDELRTEQREWAEKDAGFNPSLDEVKEISQPRQPSDFKIQERPLNKRNVEKPKRGNGSPAHTSMTQPPLPSAEHDAELT